MDTNDTNDKNITIDLTNLPLDISQKLHSKELKEFSSIFLQTTAEAENSAIYGYLKDGRLHCGTIGSGIETLYIAISIIVDTIKDIAPEHKEDYYNAICEYLANELDL